MRNIIRTLALSLGILPILSGVTLGVASAHVLKQDHGITGVLHIPPQDTPMAGQETELDVSFDSDTNKFKIDNCDCKVAVKSNGVALATVTLAPIASGAELDAFSVVRFPDVGVYDVIVSGNPRDGSFQAFKLEFLVRVASNASASASGRTQSLDILLLSAGSLGLVGLVANRYISEGGRYARPHKPSNKRR